jgi:hypothetical protein
MESTIATLRWFHIAAGTIALFVAPGAMLTVKGGRTHRRWGKIYFWAMAVVALTAVVLGLWRPNVFLTLLALFAFYNAFSGYRVLFRKRPAAGQGATALDWTATVVTLVASGALIVLGLVKPTPTWQQPGLVAIVFGALGIVLAANDLRKFAWLPADRNFWWFDHMAGMLGSYIAVVSAFSVVNFKFLPTAMRWLWPSAIGVPLIALWIIYYKARLGRTARAAVASVMTLLILAGCSEIAIKSAPAKEPRASSSPLAAVAARVFWESFSEARYENIPRVQSILTAAYLENPGDARLALLVAHTHFWKIAERERVQPLAPEITDHMILAAWYFDEARRLAPDDARIPGWLGGAKLALGNIHREERLTREGYFILKDAAAAYPAFNEFSFAYPLTGQAHDSPRFAEAVAAMWRNVEICAGRSYDRARPGFRWVDLARRSTDTGPMRACWNTARVPHNVEGFFLAFGDIMLKNGQKEVAAAAYQLIKEVPEYASWRYKPALEERLANLDVWMMRMRDSDPTNDPPYMARSPIACVGCHAR